MTCQSANQLKTPAKVSWAFKMVSQFGSLGYTIMGSWVEGKSVEEIDAQPTERTAALWWLSSKIDSRFCVNFTRNGLRLGSSQEHHTQTCQEFGTVVVRGILPGLRKTGLLPVVQSHLFRREQVLHFIWKPRP